MHPTKDSLRFQYFHSRNVFETWGLNSRVISQKSLNALLCKYTVTLIWLIQQINSLAPGKCGCNLKLLMFKLISRIHIDGLTHGGHDRMVAISQTTFSSAFPYKKSRLLNFKENFLEICSLESNQYYGSIGSDNGLVPNRWQAIIWTNDGIVYWHIYTSLCPNELMQERLNTIANALELRLSCTNPSIYWTFPVKLCSGECHKTSLMIDQHWFS